MEKVSPQSQFGLLKFHLLANVTAQPFCDEAQDRRGQWHMSFQHSNQARHDHMIMRLTVSHHVMSRDIA